MRTTVVLLALLVGTQAHAGKKKRKKDRVEAEPPATEQVAEVTEVAEPATEGEVLTLPCEWAPGTTFEYSHERRRTDATKPELAQVKTVTPLTITVTSSGLESVFSYDMGKVAYEGPPELVAQIGEGIQEIDASAMELVMREGSVVAVRNQEQLVAEMEPALGSLMPPGTPPEVIEQTLAMFRDPVTGNQLLLRDPGKLFSLHCIRMAEGEVFEAPLQYPNPFGGPPIQGQSRIALTNWDREADTITLETRDSTDPESIKAMMPAVLQKFAPEGTDLSPEKLDEMVADLPPIESQMVGTMVYSLADGFPLRVEVRTDVGAKGHPQHRSDTWIWTRTAP